MITRIPIPVAATHDLRSRQGPLIKRGTPGELTEVTAGHYTVMFWPFGPNGVTVVVDNLTRLDLREPDATLRNLALTWE